MKKQMLILLTLVGVVVLSVLSSLGCYYYLGDTQSPEKKDTVMIVQANDSIATPVADLAFTSIEQVLQDRHLVVQYSYYDSIYKRIPEDVLMNIAKVIIGRQGSATVKDIAEEFMRNYNNLYQYIAKDIESVTPAPQVQDTIKIPAIKDTVINGQHVKLLIELIMSKKLRVLVIFFVGEETDEIARGTITAALRRQCNASEFSEVIEFEGKEVAKEFIENSINLEKSANHADIVEMRTPEDEAVIYIGTIMKDELTDFNATQFIASLSNKIVEASINPNNEDNRRFMNAIFILSKEDLVISKSLLKKYKLNQQKIALIKRVYTLTSTF